jgi:hypothetical protein
MKSLRMKRLQAEKLMMERQVLESIQDETFGEAAVNSASLRDGNLSPVAAGSSGHFGIVSRTRFILGFQGAGKTELVSGRRLGK